MLNGKPVFPGASTMNQIEKVVEMLGMPTKADIINIQSAYCATMLETLPPMKTTSLQESFPSASPDALDFIRTCFLYSPGQRNNSEGLLRHIYLQEFHNEDEETM